MVSVRPTVRHRRWQHGGNATGRCFKSLKDTWLVERATGIEL